MVAAPSFSQPYLCIKPPLQSLPKIRSSTPVNFHLPIPPFLVQKIILTISTNAPFLYTSSIFAYLFLRKTIPTIYTKNIFPTLVIYPIQTASRDHGAKESCKDWHCFNLSFLPQSIDSDSRADNIPCGSGSENWCIASGSL